MGISWNESFVKAKANGEVRVDNNVTFGDEKEQIVFNEIDLPKIGSEVYEYEENGTIYSVSSIEVNSDKYLQVIDENNCNRTDLIFSNNNKQLE